MNTITIPKKEYKKLVDAKLRYDYLRQVMEQDLFAPPPTRSIRIIMKDFRETGLYNEKFLKSLEHGLRRSSYFRP